VGGRSNGCRPEEDVNEPRQATVRLVAEETATGKVAEIYRDIKKTRASTACRPSGAPWRQPDHLEMIGRAQAMMHPRRRGAKPARPHDARDHRAGGVGDEWLRVRINSHTAALRKLGMDAEAGQVMAIVGLFNSTNALADATRSSRTCCRAGLKLSGIRATTDGTMKGKVRCRF